MSEWNRREFIVKPIMWAGTAGVLAKANPLLADASQTTGPILRRALGKTGITLPIVSMGVMNADIPGILHRAYELGIRHFDTASGYQQGRNEEMVGDVIKELGVRDKVIISTKQPVRNLRPPTAEVKRRFIEGVEASLRRLQMDHVDILYYHSADSAGAATDPGPLEALQALKKDGKTRFIGVSTHNTVEVLNAVIPLKLFDVTLVTLNYTMSHNGDILSTIERAAQNGIGVIAMKTQAGGTVRPDARLPKQLPPESQTALLKWVLNHDFVTTAIPGYSTYEHLEQDFTVARNLSYTAAEKRFLDDKAFVAQAEFCQQCGKCIEDCAKKVNLPALMRAHMYAVQYRRPALAKDLLGSLTAGQGIEACGGCDSCTARCRNTVQIARKISELQSLPV